MNQPKYKKTIKSQKLLISAEIWTEKENEIKRKNIHKNLHINTHKQTCKVYIKGCRIFTPKN